MRLNKKKFTDGINAICEVAFLPPMDKMKLI